MLPSVAFQASGRAAANPGYRNGAPSPGTIDLFQQLLPFGLPVAEATIEQRPRHHDAPVATFAADADIGELRIEDHPAEAFAQRLHRRLGIPRTGQRDRLHRDHRVACAGQGILQVTGGADRQVQPRIGREWRQLLAGLAAAALHLATVGIDRLDQPASSAARQRKGSPAAGRMTEHA